MLTEERRKELKAKFQQLDANGDGHLSSKEIANGCLALGLNVPPDVVNQLIQEADANYNGLLQFDDFIQLVQRYSPNDGTVWGALLAGPPTSSAAAVLSQEQINKLRTLFESLDIDKNGHLSVAELHLLFTKSLKVKVSLDDVKNMVRTADDSGNGQLEFDEFIKVVVSLKANNSGLWGQLLLGFNPRQPLLSEVQVEQLRKRFDQLDLDGNGHVTASELYLMFKALKVPVSQATLDKLIKDADVNSNGEIEFDEFIALCCNLKDNDQDAWAQLLKATSPTQLTRAVSIATDLFGIKSDADKKDIHHYRQKSAFQTNNQHQDRDYWGKTIRQVKGYAKAKKNVKKDTEMNIVADEPVLNDPEVRKQLKEQAKVDHKPIFLLIVTLAQLGMMAAELIINGGFEEPLNNPLFGPNSLTLLHLGAKYAPCMRPNATQYALTPMVPCGTFFPEDQGTIINGTCMVDYYEYYSHLCQMGGFEIPDQGWRFFIPIFMHMGLIQIAFTVVFQIWKGFPIERDIGPLRMGVIYILSGVFGLGWSANMTPNSVSVAGTGPMFALLGLLYLDLFQNWPVIVNPWRWFAVLTVIIVVLLGIGLLPMIDNYCHLGSLIMGVLLGLVFVPHISFGVWDGRRKKIAMIVAIPIIIMCFFGVFYAFYDGQETNYCSWCTGFDCVPPDSAWCASGSVYF